MCGLILTVSSLLSRCLVGALNGNIGVIKSMMGGVFVASISVLLELIPSQS